MPATFYLGLLLLFVFILHVKDKQRRDLLPELLWACNLNNLLISVGLLIDSYWIISIGFLFQLGVGLPAHLFELIAKRETYERSIFMHFAPVLFGDVALRGRGLPPYVTLVTFLVMVVGLLTLSFYLTKPALNVNVVHQPWEPCQPFFAARMGLYRALNALLCLVFLLIAEVLSRRFVLQDSLP